MARGTYRRGGATVTVVLVLTAWGAPCRADERIALRGTLFEGGGMPRPPDRSPATGVAPLVTGAIGPAPAAEDREAGEKAPPVLRGMLVESSMAASLGTAAGYTTNAGPTLDRIGSAVATTNAEFLYARKQAGEQLSLQAAIGRREYDRHNDVSEEEYRAKADYVRELPGGSRLEISAGAGKHVDVDENLAQAQASLTYQWSEGMLAPFVQLSAAYLDYDAITGDLLEFGNQDDRDRLSATLQAGLKYRISGALSAKWGAGVDVKRYTEAFDDFGLRRDNSSVFPFLGASYEDERVSAEMLYAPVYRRYREAGFVPLLAHTLTAKAEVKATSALKLFATARAGLEETDFFIAQTAHEYVLSVGGIVTTAGGSALGLEVAYTLRDFLGLERVDHKREVTLRTKSPLGGDFFLTGEVKHMTFASSYGDAETDMLTTTMGLSYQIAR